MPDLNAVNVSPSQLKSLRKKTVLITGGSSGIGLATASLVASLSDSNNVIILDRTSPPSDLAIPPSRLLFQKCDITNWIQQRAAFAEGAKKFGRINAIFVNAGIAEYGDQFFKEEFDADGQLKEPDRRCLDIDITAACDTVKLAIHHLRKNGKEGGSIVMTASLAGYLASAGAPMYSAAKHGIVGLMRAMKQELAKLNIAISTIAPGITMTPILRVNRDLSSIEEWAKQMKKHGVPINKAETIALAVGYLIDGGMKANGMGLLIQEDQIAELESGIARSRGSWMGENQLSLFRGGRNAPLFSRI